MQWDEQHALVNKKDPDLEVVFDISHERNHVCVRYNNYMGTMEKKGMTVVQAREEYRRLVREGYVPDHLYTDESYPVE